MTISGIRGVIDKPLSREGGVGGRSYSHILARGDWRRVRRRMNVTVILF